MGAGERGRGGESDNDSGPFSRSPPLPICPSPPLPKARPGGVTRRPTIDATSIIAIIGATTAATVTIINALVAFKTAQKVETLVTKADQTESVARTLAVVTERQGATVADKLDVIHDLTNSNLATVKKALDIANARIERLEQQLGGAQQKLRDTGHELEGGDSSPPSAPVPT